MVSPDLARSIGDARRGGMGSAPWSWRPQLWIDAHRLGCGAQLVPGRVEGFVDLADDALAGLVLAAAGAQGHRERAELALRTVQGAAGAGERIARLRPVALREALQLGELPVGVAQRVLRLVEEGHAVLAVPGARRARQAVETRQVEPGDLEVDPRDVDVLLRLVGRLRGGLLARGLPEARVRGFGATRVRVRGRDGLAGRLRKRRNRGAQRGGGEAPQEDRAMHAGEARYAPRGSRPLRRTPGGERRAAWPR